MEDLDYTVLKEFEDGRAAVCCARKDWTKVSEEADLLFDEDEVKILSLAGVTITSDGVVQLIKTVFPSCKIRRAKCLMIM